MATDKGEQDFKVATEDKQFQDKFNGQPSEKVEQLDSQCG